MDDPQFLMEIVQSVGMWAIFAYLYLNERRHHDDTKKAYIEDMRDIAGMRPTLPAQQTSP